MLRYTIKKLGYGVLTLFGVVTVIFYLFHFLPGDPARMMLGQNESAEQLAAVKKKYGFDQPLGQQYLYYLNDLSLYHGTRSMTRITRIMCPTVMVASFCMGVIQDNGS